MSKKVKHSNKALSNTLGRLQTPLLGRGWGRLLLTAFVLLVSAGYAFAQNNSANPYIDSWHKYTIPMGVSTHTVVWELYDDLGQPADYTLDGSQLWAVSAINGTDAEIEIKFVDANFDPLQTWYLVYSEMDGNMCTARRSMTINTVANPISFTVPADDSNCSSFSGLTWGNSDDLTDNQNGTVAYTVTMNKLANHLVKKWRFNGTVSYSDAAYSSRNPLLSTTAGTTAIGTWAITSQSGDDFTMEVTVTDPSTNSGLSNTVTFELDIVGPPTTEVGVTLTIVSGEADSGTNYDVITDGNGSGKVSQIRTLWGIPNTSEITVTP